MSKKQDAKNEVATTQGTEAAIAGQGLDAWGDTNVDSRDVVIPKILLMQSTSEFVGEGTAKLGDFVDQLDKKVIGGFDRPIYVVPFHMEKVWIISKKGTGDSKFVFDRYEPVGTQQYPLTERVGDVEWKYEYTQQFYCLRLDDPSLPYVIAFKSTSSKAGKALTTQMYVRNKTAGKIPPAYVMEISSRKEKNDKGTFAVMEVKQSQETPPELIAEAYKWFKTVKSGSARVAAEDVGAYSGNYAPEDLNF